MKKFLNIIFVSAFILLVAAPLTTVVLPVQASAGPSCEGSFLGIPPWYRGLTADDCSIAAPDPNDSEALQNFIWKIVLNGVQMALVLAAYIAIFFVLYGGFLFMTGGNNPTQVEKARKSIFNAIIGLVIAMGAIAITNFIFQIYGTKQAGSNGVVELTGEELMHNALNLVYFIAGTVAVIVIVIAGINYVTSAGDASKVTRAKNMLTYSIVGLVIVLSAFAITNFVTGSFA